MHRRVYREHVMRGEQVLLQCDCPRHNGEFIHEDKFCKIAYILKDGTRMHTRKKMCAEHTRAVKNRGRYPHLELHGKVPVVKVEKWVWELVHRCKTFKSAALTAGVKEQTLLGWLGRSTHKANPSMSRRSAERVMFALAGLRNGEITPVITKRPRRYQYGCAGCGTKLELFTPGCYYCTGRRYDAEIGKVIVDPDERADRGLRARNVRRDRGSIGKKN